MVGIGNQLRDWARMAEQTLGRTIDKAMGGRAASGQGGFAVRAATGRRRGRVDRASPATQRGRGERANQARAAEQEQSRYLELERQRERAQS
jgi:hypothetical protein